MKVGNVCLETSLSSLLLLLLVLLVVELPDEVRCLRVFVLLSSVVGPGFSGSDCG
jgi:hypothetical protein